jgi:hypothetical protein
MLPAHVSIGKAAYITVTVVAVAFYALDPTVQVALIAGTALVLTNVPAIIIALLNRKAVDKMSINVDGNLKRLLDDKAAASAEHLVTSEKLAHAEGLKQGSDDERDRDKWTSVRSIRFIRKSLTSRGHTSEYVVGYGCTQCAWLFDMKRPCRGATVVDSMNIFNNELDEEFEKHDCGKYPRRSQ